MNNAHGHESQIYKKVFDTAIDAIIIINAKGLIQDFNSAAEKMFLYKKKEVIDKNVNILMPEPHHSKHDKYLKKYFKTGEKFIIGKGRQLEAKNKKGEIFPIHLSVNEIKIEQDTYFAGIIRDITLQLNNEKILQDQNDKFQSLNKDLESFSYSVSHDLSAPLRHIVGYSELLKKELANTKNKNIDKYFKVIQNEALRMDELIKSLLKFSRLGRESLRIEQVDFNNLITEIIGFYSPETASREINWQIEKLPNVKCDKKMLKIVWENLISNALKFTKNNTKTNIKIKYLKSGEYDQFTIEDNGIGFNPNHTDKLFKVFQRLHANKDFQGNGVGLVNIKQIIEKHHGKVWIEAQENEGAKVFFTLPIISVS